VIRQPGQQFAGLSLRASVGRQVAQRGTLLAPGRAARASDCFKAINSGERASLMGRPLPAVDVSYQVAQVEGQLYGGGIAGATGATRPWAAVHCGAKPTSDRVCCVAQPTGQVVTDRTIDKKANVIWRFAPDHRGDVCQSDARGPVGSARQRTRIDQA
jgi:hypothetical protein